MFEEYQEGRFYSENINSAESNEDKAGSDLLMIYQVISSYAADAKGEVSLSMGNTVEVLQQSGNGWWLGSLEIILG